LLLLLSETIMLGDPISPLGRAIRKMEFAASRVYAENGRLPKSPLRRIFLLHRGFGPRRQNRSKGAFLPWLRRQICIFIARKSHIREIKT
jgi:hypothetical protein